MCPADEREPRGLGANPSSPGAGQAASGRGQASMPTSPKPGVGYCWKWMSEVRVGDISPRSPAPGRIPSWPVGGVRCRTGRGPAPLDGVIAALRQALAGVGDASPALSRRCRAVRPGRDAPGHHRHMAEGANRMLAEVGRPPAEPGGRSTASSARAFRISYAVPDRGGGGHRGRNDDAVSVFAAAPHEVEWRHAHLPAWWRPWPFWRGGDRLACVTGTRRPRSPSPSSSARGLAAGRCSGEQRCPPGRKSRPGGDPPSLPASSGGGGRRLMMGTRKTTPSRPAGRGCRCS